MAQTVGATDLRQRLNDVLQAVREQRETYVIETFGRPQAAIINLDEYELFLRYQRERTPFIEWLDQAGSENAEHHRGLSDEQVVGMIRLARAQVTAVDETLALLEGKRPTDQRNTSQ
jgi:prevent-host-death family protein